MLANMLVPQSDLPHLPVDQSATGCSYAWLAACAPLIVIFWLLIRRWVSSQPQHCHRNRNLPGEVNSARETCIYPAMDRRSASLDWKKDFTNQSDSRSSFRLVFILGLCVLYGLFLLGHLPLAHSFLQGSHPLIRWSSVTSTSTALQNVFQVYHPVPFNSSGDNGCDVVVLLMDHVFGASYGAPFVGERLKTLAIAVLIGLTIAQITMSPQVASSILFVSISRFLLEEDNMTDWHLCISETMKCFAHQQQSQQNMGSCGPM